MNYKLLFVFLMSVMPFSPIPVQAFKSTTHGFVETSLIGGVLASLFTGVQYYRLSQEKAFLTTSLETLVNRTVKTADERILRERMVVEYEKKNELLTERKKAIKQWLNFLLTLSGVSLGLKVLQKKNEQGMRDTVTLNAMTNTFFKQNLSSYKEDGICEKSEIHYPLYSSYHAYYSGIWRYKTKEKERIFKVKDFPAILFQPSSGRAEAHALVDEVLIPTYVYEGKEEKAYPDNIPDSLIQFLICLTTKESALRKRELSEKEEQKIKEKLQASYDQEPFFKRIIKRLSGTTYHNL